ncbi:hypothetical protein FRC12_022237 [Ceratobasidium sp. 428]|nr:hypothetical protein FRC12_022237 [Ceratobasidium sp. 428]
MRGQPNRTFISGLPNEILELIASQIILSFRDVISFSLVSRRIHSATQTFVSRIARPLHVEDSSGTMGLEKELTNPTLKSVRAAVVDVNFVLTVPQHHSEQLRQFLSRMPRLRHLSICQPTFTSLQSQTRRRDGRPTTSVYPFPLRASHFQDSSLYLNNLTHLEICGLSVNPFLFARLPWLTYLKLSIARHGDGYSNSEALSLINAARGCSLTSFEISLHAPVRSPFLLSEDIPIAKACVSAWPDLQILNLFSVEKAVVPRTSELIWQDLSRVVPDLSEILKPARRLRKLALGLVPLDEGDLRPPSPSTDSRIRPTSLPASGSLAAIAAELRTSCPKLEVLRCVALPIGTVKPEYLEVVRADWTHGAWECIREEANREALAVARNSESSGKLPDSNSRQLVGLRRRPAGWW